MDTAPPPWPQEIVVKPMEEIITNTNPTTAPCSSISLPNHNINHTHHSNTTTTKPSHHSSTPLERKARPPKDQALNCPRCNSTNTKFCYYNNYSLSQPRYFCKTCRRYWTEGGSLRNIPVGGGSRKNKRSSSISSASSSPSIVTSSASKIKLPDLVVAPPSCSSSNPNGGKILHHGGQDLNLGFPTTLSEFMNLTNIETKNAQMINPNPNPSNTLHQSALELLTGHTYSRGLNSFAPIQIPDPNNGVYPTGFPIQGADFKPTLSFSLDHELGINGSGPSGYGNGNMQERNGIGGRVLFPFEDLKSKNNNTVTTTTTTTTKATTATVDQDYHHHRHSHGHDQQIGRDHHHQGDSTGYWIGMLGGDGSW